MTLPKIILVGATGDLGSRILDALLRFFPSSLTILTRESSAPPSNISDLIVKIVPSYSNHAALVSALQGQDVLVSALGTPALEFEPYLVHACIEAGVGKFMPSEYTMDVNHPFYQNSASTDIAKTRIAWAKELAAIAARGDIVYTTLVCGPLYDTLFGTVFWRYDVKNRKAIEYGEGMPGTGCSTEFVGQCVAAVLRMPEAETRNRRIRIAETKYTVKDVLKELETATGAKWEVERKDLSALLVEEKKKLDEGDGWGAYVAWVVRLNLYETEASMFEDGLKWNEEGEYKVDRKSLAEIIEKEVKRLDAK